MDNPNIHPLSDGLVYEEHLALQWSTLEAKPDVSESAAIEESNLDVLRTLFMLGDYFNEPSDEPANLGQELARMDFKLNLVLDMLGEVLSYYHELPAKVPVRLGAQGVEWEAAAAPPVESLVGIDLYLNTRCPRVLRLMGRVRSVTPLAHGGLRSVVQFEDMDEAVQELLEKLIFRHHRRRIAHARRSSAPH